MQQLILKDRYLISANQIERFELGYEVRVFDLENNNTFIAKLSQDKTKLIKNTKQRITRNKQIVKVELFEDLQNNGVYRMSALESKEYKLKGKVTCYLMDYNTNEKKSRVVVIENIDGMPTVISDTGLDFTNETEIAL